MRIVSIGSLIGIALGHLESGHKYGCTPTWHTGWAQGASSLAPATRRKRAGASWLSK